MGRQHCSGHSRPLQLPTARCQTLVIPQRHVVTLADLEPGEIVPFSRRLHLIASTMPIATGCAEPSWPTTMSSARKLPTRTCAGSLGFGMMACVGFPGRTLTCKAGELEAVGTRLRDVFSYLDGSGITVAVASQYLPRYGLFEKSLHLQTLLGLRSRVSGKSH